MYQNENEPSLLEIELGLDQEPASLGQRFVNILIDFLGFYIFVIIISFIWVIVDIRQAVIYVEEIKTSPENRFLNSLVTIVLWIIYYTVIEGAFKGRTLGKLITKTKVIKEDGAPIGWKEAFLRSLSRMVPIEPFSAFFGNGLWHDTWTRTKVVKVIR